MKVNNGVLTISHPLVNDLGLQDGDEFELFMVDGALILRPFDETKRQAKLDHNIQGLLRRRGIIQGLPRRHSEVYEAFALGVK